MYRGLLSWKTLMAMLLAFAFLGAAVPNLVGENPPKPQVLKSKVFRLQYCDPNDVMEIYQGLMDENETPLPMQPLPMNPQGQLGGQLGLGGGGALGLAGGIGGLGALGIGGGLGGMGAPVQNQVTVDNRTRSLIVRATEKNLQLATDLVAVLDLPKDKPLPQVKSLKAFQLKHADAEELLGVLQNLETDARMTALGEAKMLIVAGPDASMMEIADLVKELDVPTPPQLKPSEERKLLTPKGN